MSSFQFVLFQYNIAAPVNEDDCEEDEEEDEYGAKKKEELDSDDPVERKFSVFSSIICEKYNKAHPSLNGRVAKILTRELVYYILFGTLRGSQKYH